MTAGDALETSTHEPKPHMTRAAGALDARPDDAAVVARSVRDPDQFAAIYDRYIGEVYRYVAGRLGPEIHALAPTPHVLATPRRFA